MVRIIIISETEEEKALSDFELKKCYFGYARQKFQGKKFMNKNTGIEIQVSREGLGEWKTKTKSREQILSIQKLDKLLENSEFMKFEKDTKNRRHIAGFDYYAQNIKINNKEYIAVLTIKKTLDEGDKYYHHYLAGTKIELPSEILRQSEKQSNASLLDSSPSGTPDIITIT
jgi:hypothetical protein